MDPKIFGGKPSIRGRRLAVEHVLGMVVAGDRPETILAGYTWLESGAIVTAGAGRVRVRPPKDRE